MWRGNIKNLHKIISSSAQSRETIPLSRHIENEKTILCSHFYGPLWNEMTTLSRPLYGHIETEMTTFSSIYKAIFEKNRHLAAHCMTILKMKLRNFDALFMALLKMKWRHLDLAPLFKAIFKIKASIIIGPLHYIKPPYWKWKDNIV